MLCAALLSHDFVYVPPVYCMDGTYLVLGMQAHASEEHVRELELHPEGITVEQFEHLSRQWQQQYRQHNGLEGLDYCILNDLFQVRAYVKEDDSTCMRKAQAFSNLQSVLLIEQRVIHISLKEVIRYDQYVKDS